MARDGSRVHALVESWLGARLNSPNDVVCRSDGHIYITDPPYGVKPAERALHSQGLFLLDPRQESGAGPRLLADDFE
jgi:gluconolactonase